MLENNIDIFDRAKFLGFKKKNNKWNSNKKE